MLDKDKEPTDSANMAGKPLINQDYWIVDSGATNHMTSSLNLLSDPTSLPSPQ